MTDHEQLNEAVADAPIVGAGPQLRMAREALGLSVATIAERTRISGRHIEHLDAGEFAALPGRIYAIGFAKTYAKEVGLDPEAIAARVRIELGDAPPSASAYGDTFEPGDPARAPGRKLLWFSVFAVLLLLAGLFAFAREMFAPAASLPSLTAQQEAEQAASRAAQAAAQREAARAPAPTGAVTITAQGEAWVRIADGEGRQLMEGILAEGDAYTIPADAKDPQISTARPDLLAITIGGKAVPKLAEEMQTLMDVPVSASALLARGKPSPAAGASPAPASPAPATPAP